MLVEDIRSIAQQQVARPLQDFALVDVLFQVILRPAYLVQLLIHQFDHMKMVEDMHHVRAVFKYGGDESGREMTITIHTLALVAADFHPQNYLLASDRKADKVASAKTILPQMGMTALGTTFRSSFTFDMLR